MASNTENLDLLMKNPSTDGADTFNVQTMLNDNWDKIDQFAGSLNKKLAGLLHDDTKTELLLPPTATPDDAFKILAGILGITYVLASSGATVTAQSGNDTKRRWRHPTAWQPLRACLTATGRFRLPSPGP